MFMLREWFVCCVVGVGLGLCAVIPVYADETQPVERVWNFRHMPLSELITTVARETHKVFLMERVPNQTITLTTKKAMNSDELYYLFLQILSVHGYYAVPDKHNIVKIVQKNDAKFAGVYGDPFPGKGLGEFVVQVVPLRFVMGSNVVGLLQNMLPNASLISHYAPSNSVIIGAKSDDIHEAMKVIQKLDNVDAHTIYQVRVHKGLASDMLNKVKILMGASKTTHAWLYNAIPDDTSSQILYAGNAAQRDDLATLIQTVEQKQPQNNSQLSVVRLKFQTSSDLIPVLSSVAQAYYARTTLDAKATMVGSLTAGPTLTTSSLTSSSGEGANASSGGGSTATGSAASLTPPGFVIGSVSVQSESNMNALVINAPREVMRLLKRVVTELDVRQPQVLVEAVVAEVSRDLSRDFGVDFSWVGKATGGTNFSSTSGTALKATDLPVAGGLSIGFIRNMDIRTLIKIIASDSDTNILSTPSLVTLDGKQASIKVTNNIPVTTGGYSSTGTTGSTTPFNTYEYKDVGIVLNILPRITHDESVQLQVHQEVQEVQPSATPQATTNNPTFTTREVDTTVLVDDQNILVLGGLIQTKNTKTVNKVPILGDIPLFGHLFKSTSAVNNKSTLMIFLRPVIMRDAEGTKKVTKEQYKVMYEAENDLKKHTSTALKINEGALLGRPDKLSR
jgi:general secretion pathway protein D